MSTLVERLAELVKGVGISSVYGEPTELNGVHIMPVALSFHAFGAGEGKGHGHGGGAERFDGEGEGEGAGGGGYAASVPFGAYIRDIRGLRFEPNLITLIAVATPLVAVSGWTLRSLMRASRRRGRRR